MDQTSARQRRGIDSTPSRFGAVEVHVEAKGSPAEIERLVEIADRGCIMMNTLRGKLDVTLRARVAA